MKALEVLVVTLLLCLAIASPATADTKNSDLLGTLWTKVLQTPAADNPFGSGDPSTACWKLGNRTVAPFGPAGVATCDVASNTTLLIVASSVECSTFEGTAKADLKTCAAENDLASAPPVTVDGHAVAITEAATQQLNIQLPKGNIFDKPAGSTGYSRGHGWLTRLNPLTLGTHTIVISFSDTQITTTINVIG